MKTSLEDIKSKINELRQRTVLVDWSGIKNKVHNENWLLYLTNDPEPVLNKIKGSLKASFPIEGFRNVDEIISEIEKENEIKIQQQSRPEKINDNNLHMVVEVWFN